VKDGVLVGGFLALKGFGEVKAKKFIDLRNANKLTSKHLAEIEKASNIFADIFPMRTKYGKYYADSDGLNVQGKIKHIDEFDGSQIGSEVFIGEIVYKNARNANEEVNVKKRNGKKETGPLEFLDLRLRDDTGMIGARISRWDFERIGRDLLESVPVGAHLLVRAKFIKGIRFGFITKYKRLDA
jgi:hypothetical protein